MIVAAAAFVVAALLEALQPRVHGQPGYLVIGVLGLVAAGLASAALWDWQHDRVEASARAAEQLEAEKAYDLPPAVSTGGVTRFLRPEEEFVSFWPRPELDNLIGWTVSEEWAAIQLVIGPGGTGKTRLARKLVEKLTDLDVGLRYWWVPPDAGEDVARMARDAEGLVLVIIDYAEMRVGLQELLSKIISNSDRLTMRILLLARGAGEWWEQLINRSGYRLREMLVAAPPILLEPVSDKFQQSEIFDQALVNFAAKLKAVCPEVENSLAEPEAVMLVIHAAALLAVLENGSAGHDASVPYSRSEVLNGLLRHEASYWQRTQATYGLELDTQMMRRAIAAACLVGADNESAAVALLSRLSGWADDSVRRAVFWLRDLYPVPQAVKGEEWVGGLQPDLVLEHLVVDVFTGQPDLIEILFKGLTGKRAIRALTILARAALTDSVAGQQA